MINIEVGGEDFAGLGEEALNELRPWAEREVTAGAELIASNARALLGRRGSGRNVKRVMKRGRRRTVVDEQASAPGEPPAIHDGRLQKSIKATKAKWRRNLVTAAAGPKGKRKGDDMAAVGTLLEFGGRVGKNHAVVLAPRPFMRPAETAARPVIDARLARE